MCSSDLDAVIPSSSHLSDLSSHQQQVNNKPHLSAIGAHSLMVGTFRLHLHLDEVVCLHSGDQVPGLNSSYSDTAVIGEI